MKIPGMLLIGALVFGACFLIDKVFLKIFRNKKQHKSGKSVRLNKRFVTIGVLVSLLGIVAVFAGIGQNLLLLLGGCFLAVVGICLIVYYLSFGVFYDEDGFVLTTFGKKSVCYQYKQIVGQQLFNSYHNLVAELILDDGRSFQLVAGMDGMYSFFDYASAAWMRQNNLDPEECDFYNPENSCWFPNTED